MKKKYKVLLLVSNICLIVIGMNVFLNFIPFESSKINPILIFILCLINVSVALKASFDATNEK
jgi:hypothetical protein